MTATLIIAIKIIHALLFLHSVISPKRKKSPFDISCKTAKIKEGIFHINPVFIFTCLFFAKREN